MNQTTFSRLLESVFSGEFSPQYTSIKNDDINKVLEDYHFHYQSPKEMQYLEH